MRRLVVAIVIACTLTGCEAIIPTALFIVDAVSKAATVTEATCRSGEILAASNPEEMAKHPHMQTAEKVCEALAP